MSWLAVKALLGKAWANITLIVLAVAGGAVFILHKMLGKEKDKTEKVEAKLEVKKQQVEGYEHAMEARSRAEQAAHEVAESEAKRRDERKPDLKGRADFERPPWER